MAARALFITAALSIALIVSSSCRKSDPGSSGTSDSHSAALSPEEKDAIDAVVAEVKRHWTKSADGYVSAYNSGNAFAPNFLRQVQDIAAAGVESSDLSQADRLNGIQWAGNVNFKKTPSREAGEQGPVLADSGFSVTRTRGRWSQWVDVTPESVRAQKIRGQWQFQKETMLLNGTQPMPADYQTAGVKP